MKVYYADPDDNGFVNLFDALCVAATQAPPVDTGHWQALKDVPMTKTHELHNVSLEIPISEQRVWGDYIEPNLPWAEDHFLERVGGEPLNPGVQYKNWPYYRGNVEQHQTEAEAQFTHTYMERIWPRWADSDIHSLVVDYDGTILTGQDMEGIRYRYGDLNDVVALLAREPYTRQAYLPIWFPEDTGGHHGGRLPCTLGYHFMLRQNRLHCFYPIRSCDLLRHFKDDVYMAGRLVQWLIQRVHGVGGGKGVWGAVLPGDLTMFIPSLHIFEGDVPILRKRYKL